MNLDISKIVNDKLAQMEADGTMKKQIEDSLEKVIRDAIKGELEGYTLERAIREQLKTCVADIAGDIGLSAYNGVLAARVKDIVSDVMADDMQSKVEAAVKGILVQKHDNVKLSDIFKQYREWIRSYVDESDQREREDGFICRVDRRHSTVSRYDNIKCYFKEDDDPDSNRLSEYDIAFSFGLVGPKDTEAVISELWISGANASKQFVFRYLSDLEKLLLNLFWNKTPIILDTDEIDNDDHYFETEDY